MAKTTELIVAASSEITSLIEQNQQIRLENQQLRQKLESSLAEQFA